MIQGIVRNDLLVIREDQLKFILPAFKTDKTTICKNLIKSLYWALSLNKNALRPSDPENSQKILKIADKLLSSDDKSLTNTAREVVKLCKNLGAPWNSHNLTNFCHLWLGSSRKKITLSNQNFLIN